MYSEVGFIFSPALDKTVLDNKDNTGDIYGRIKQIRPRRDNNTSSSTNTPATNQPVAPQSQFSTTPVPAQDAVLVFKGPDVIGTTKIKNYLKNNVFANDDSNEDPYIALINHFNDANTKALKLKAADFAYLKDLGVYPINRLWVLRRFPDNCIVPNNLLAWGKAVEPISTVIGWFKYKEDSDLLSLSFGENWIDQNDTLDKVIGAILKDMGISGADKIMSVPGWSQGLLWGLLNAMGLSGDYSATNVPTGDPNVLRTSKMRDINSQGLVSDMNLTLETSYEQKYINGIDPGMAMLDVLSNLFKMGTSEMRYMLGNSEALQKLITATYSPANKGADAWMSFIKTMVKSFIEGVETFKKEVTSAGTSGDLSAFSQEPPTNTNEEQKNNSTNFEIGNASSIVGNVVSTLLAGTIYKNRWPLKGSIALMSGINTTPWHLTIGNPYSPVINMGNAWVSNVDVKLSNDMGFNDMPIRVDASINCRFGRQLGRSELERLFNNGYKRVYAKPVGGDGTATAGEEPNSPVTPDGSTAPNNVSGLFGGLGSGPDQPNGTLSYINNSVNPYLDNTGNPPQFGGFGGGKFGGGGAGGNF